MLQRYFTRPLLVLPVLLITIGAIFILVAAQSAADDTMVEPLLIETGLMLEQAVEHDVTALEGPWVVAIQPGHWKIDELPEEHARRRGNIGGVSGGVREVDINVAVAGELVRLVEAEGWTAVVVPATVPPGLRADAFISIHADWSSSRRRHGWKLASPWGPSEAASDLSHQLRQSFRAEPELQEDAGGVTIGMRGYYGFSHGRFVHASSPYTPAVLVELGFVTHDDERTRMSEYPDYYAAIIHRGLVNHFVDRDRTDTATLIPRHFGIMVAADSGTPVLASSDPLSDMLQALEAGELVQPLDKANGWYEVRLRTTGQLGWINGMDLMPHESLLVAAGD
jgi:N-acetylmuramoyl-L-alanine amidase